MSETEEYINMEKDFDVNQDSNDDTLVEEQRESLCILASHLGVPRCRDESWWYKKKLLDKDVKKYYNRYQIVSGKQVTGGLVKSAINLSARLVSTFVFIDNTEELAQDLQNDQLVCSEVLWDAVHPWQESQVEHSIRFSAG